MTKKSTLGVLVLLLAIVGFMFASLSTVQPVSVEAQQPTSTPKPIGYVSPDWYLASAGIAGGPYYESGWAGQSSNLNGCVPSGWAPKVWNLTQPGGVYYQDWNLGTGRGVGSTYRMAASGGGPKTTGAIYEGTFVLRVKFFDNTGAVYATHTDYFAFDDDLSTGCTGDTWVYGPWRQVPAPGAGKSFDHVRIFLMNVDQNNRQVAFTKGGMSFQ